MFRAAFLPIIRRFLAVHRLWYTLCSCDRLLPGVGWNAERLPETCRIVIPRKLEFSASVGFIHKGFRLKHFSFYDELSEMLHKM
jgi:hypothetical protein